MNTSYEAVKSLIGLLVKKSGFDIDKNYAHEELRKTKETIKKLESDESMDLSKEQVEKLLDNLKIREEIWENNAEVIGKSILSSYKANDELYTVQNRIDKLSSLASVDVNSIKDVSLMSYLYENINKLEEKTKEIAERIEKNDYINYSEKEMDEKLLNHLNEKLQSSNQELNVIGEELERFRDIELNDVSIVEKLKKYISNIKKDVETLEKIKKASLDKGITIETWEKLESIELGIKDKLEKASSVMFRTEKTLENVRNSIKNYLNNKKKIEDEISKYKDKIIEITEKISNDDYLDYTKKISDINEKEIVRIELAKLKNKKEVVYVDVHKVKEELIKEWDKDKVSSNTIKEEVIDQGEKEVEELPTIKEEKEIDKIIEEKETVQVKNKIELDW